MTPTTGQLALLLFAAVLFAVGGGVSLARLWSDQRAHRRVANGCFWAGVLVTLGVLLWHSLRRYQASHTWLPLEDSFDALTWLGLLLAVFVLYVQHVRPVGGLEWFAMPIVILFLIGAVVFGATNPRPYLPNPYLSTTWRLVHSISSYGGAVGFAVAAAAGGIYLVARRRLRSKSLVGGPHLGSLERLERLMLSSVTLGFALLTLGLVTGVIGAVEEGSHSRLGQHWFATPKVLLGCAVWVVYALVLHSPINPRFRGRKTALLSILGFVLMVGTVLAVQFMPEAR